MSLGVSVGKGCASLLDYKMRKLSCQNIQFDELWGFIGKKERHVQPNDNPDCGDVWTFCAIDSDTKLVPSFKVGKRTLETANAFVGDVATRMANRIQISEMVAGVCGGCGTGIREDVDYAQIIKTYGPMMNKDRSESKPLRVRLSGERPVLAVPICGLPPPAMLSG